ncbi:MAG: hypothetical protein FJ090_13605 [Deltaproteobacteria bacterium]|nr:hypothetical protein [Deltaproteobacteria bacterium]
MDVPPHPRDRIPGCGLAAYVVLLFFIGSAGAVGVVLSWGTLITGSEALAPTRLSYGGVIDPAVLHPMRNAKLIAENEVPDAFHAETPDGAAACAISSGKVLRLSSSGAQSIALGDVQSVGMVGENVRIAGSASEITCVFREGEGGDSFLRMLERR